MMTTNGLLATPYRSVAHGGVGARPAPQAIAAFKPGLFPELSEPEDEPSSSTAAALDGEICFGPFCLRPAQRELYEADALVRIGGRGLDLLIALVERAGELVAKDDLVARAWPSVSVCESNLKTQIAALRHALRDGRDGARYIVSIPGRGYCFVAPTARASEKSASPLPAAPVSPPRSLPIRVARPIGRAGVIKELVGRLERRRFVTLVGPSGIGKTVTALAVAKALETSARLNACFVDLSELADPSQVTDALAAALGVAAGAGEATKRIIAYLRAAPTLIVLDCCDRVVEAAAVLAERIIAGAPDSRILATSREPLQARGESLTRLQPLETPPDSDGLTAVAALAYASVQLFVERVACNGDDFELSDADAPIIAEICRRLDGLPLAIELAAGHIHAFGARGIAALLGERFQLRMRGRRTAQQRHQTLGAAFDWSCQGLSEGERVVLRRLSTLAGAFTLDVACAMATDAVVSGAEVAEIVAELVGKSLVQADVNTTPGRYRLLETTRACIQEKFPHSDETLGLALRRDADMRNGAGAHAD
jgi:predicted ATPase/DNA-binding winged helix-turn-helix (wHTH) protein